MILQSFFDARRRLNSATYLPTDQDILQTRVKTTGITETSFSTNGISYSVCDPGGVRSERKKWIRVSEGVTTIIFMVDLAAYDRVLVEDETANRMEEQLTLFESVCAADCFVNARMVLFFHKVDLLKDKLGTRPLEDYFPDYCGGNDFEAAKSYISDKFLRLNRCKYKSISVHFTDFHDEIAFAEVARNAILDGIAPPVQSISKSISVSTSTCVETVCDYGLAL